MKQIHSETKSTNARPRNDYETEETTNMTSGVEANHSGGRYETNLYISVTIYLGALLVMDLVVRSSQHLNWGGLVP